MKEDHNFASIAAIRTLYDSGRDMLDAVCSMVILLIEEEETIKNLAINYSDTYSTDIPVDVLGTVLKRLKRNGHVTYKSLKDPKDKIKITDKGRKLKSAQENSVADVLREFRGLVSSLKSHIDSRNNKKVSLLQVEKLLISFIDENIGITSSIVAGNGKNIRHSSPVAEFIVEVERSDPGSYLLLQRIFFGRLFLNLIKTRKEYTTNISFGELKVAIDTNVAFSLLGLHGTEAKDRSLELLNILVAASNVVPIILDITIDEALRVLRAYETRKGEYFNRYAVDSLYQHLKTEGFDRHKLALLAEEFQNRLEELGIKIEIVSENVRSIAKEDTGLQDEISTWAGLANNDKKENAILHDTTALTFVKQARKGVSSSLLEKSKCLFLSSDTSLKELSIEQQKKNGGAQIVWRPVELVSYLWLRDLASEETANALIRQSMMAYAREKLISHNLWEKFIDELKRAKKENQLSDDQIAYILAAEETKNILIERREKGISELVSPNYVEKIVDETGNLNRTKNKYDTIINHIKLTSRRIAEGIAVFVGLIISVFIVLVAYLIINQFGWDKLEPIIWLLGITIVFVWFLAFGKPPTQSEWVLKHRERFVAHIEKQILSTLNKLIGVKDD